MEKERTGRGTYKRGKEEGGRSREWEERRGQGEVEVRKERRGSNRKGGRRV